MLDLIISKYVTLCEKKNIKFSVDVKTANLAYVSDSDLSTLMNNLLDNAVEATERADERFIQVYIFSKGSMHDGLVIKNSCAVSPKAFWSIIKSLITIYPQSPIMLLPVIVSATFLPLLTVILSARKKGTMRSAVPPVKISVLSALNCPKNTAMRSAVI